MPLRNRVRFTFGFAVLLGASAGMAGCQTASVLTEGYPGGASDGPLAGKVIASSNPADAAARPAATLGPVSAWQPAQPATSLKPSTEEVVRVSDPPSAGGAAKPLAVAAPPGEPAPLNQPRLEPEPIVVDPGHPAVLAPVQPSPPHEFAKQPLPPYVVEPPDVLLVEATKQLTGEFQPIANQHLVRPDGTVSLGTYGNVFLAGLTLDEARDAIAAKIQVVLNKKTIEDIKKELVVDVLAYNSKVYYVITDGGGYGEQVYPIPVTGNETVLDALSKINGLPPVASKKRIWVARASEDCNNPHILPVDWCGITQRGCVATNYQVFPNDRIYVASDPWIRAESWLSKRLNPVDRVMGSVLLGASTVNQIRNRVGTGTGGIP